MDFRVVSLIKAFLAWPVSVILFSFSDDGFDGFNNAPRDVQNMGYFIYNQTLLYLLCNFISNFSGELLVVIILFSNVL